MAVIRGKIILPIFWRSFRLQQDLVGAQDDTRKLKFLEKSPKTDTIN
jgi:hypothetical protein